MGRPDLVDDKDYATDAVRLERRDEVVALVETWLSGFDSVEQVIETLETHHIPCAPVLTVEETLSHPHLVARGTVRTVKDSLGGDFQIPGMPIRTSDYPANPDYRAPGLGEHNREVLETLLERSEAEIKALYESGVLVERA